MISSHTPLFIVCNRASGSGDTDEARTQIEGVLTAAQREHEFLLVEDPKELPGIARCAAEAATARGGAVVAAGGDGTINTVAQATLLAGLPFGIIPQGTFNYSSRTHGIPSDIHEATRALLSARIKPIQVGEVNDRIFLVNAGLGLYPRILEDREKFKAQYGRYRAVAIWAGLTTLAHWRHQLALEIVHDRQTEIVHTPTLFIGNNPLQLEQVGLPEAEAVQHRRLAAVVIAPVSPFGMFGLALRGAVGKLGEATGVRDFAFRELVVRPMHGTGRRRMRLAVDGEVHWMTPPFRFRVAKMPLNLLVPASVIPEA
ncbi:MAG: diacylglycerol kinase family protein [Polyangiaceae bacterium]|nr:diacylglycerol kinase family protein [Polyangiaceae bacterium]